MVKIGAEPPAHSLDSLAPALSLCTYCPSLCRHACPVATAEATDTTSPWGLMSLVDHTRRGLVELSEVVAERLYHCVGCGACTAFCVHDNPVGDTLVSARAHAVAQGVAPIPLDRLIKTPLRLDDDAFASVLEVERYEYRPTFSLLPGRAALEHAPDALAALFELCDGLDLDSLSVGEAAQLDVGYGLWFAGYHREFLSAARKVFAALSRAQQVVVMSPQDMFMLCDIYPRFGLTIEAEVVHLSEFLLPVVSGGIIRRLPGRVGYQESCLLARHLRNSAVPRQVLERVLEEPVVELAYHHDKVQCCGGAGCLGVVAPESARTMAEAVVAQATDAGLDVLVSFSPECVVALREVAPPRLEIAHAVSLIVDAVEGDGAVL